MKKSYYLIVVALMVGVGFASCGHRGAAPIVPLPNAPIRAADTVNVMPDAALAAKPEMFLANSSYVSAYFESDSGNIAPRVLIAGTATNFSSSMPAGIAVSVGGGPIFTVDKNATESVFAAGANGNVAPIMVISCGGVIGSGSFTYGAVDAAGNLYVSNNGTGPSDLGSIAILPPGSSGCVSGNHVLKGPNTGLNRPVGVAIDREGEIYVVNRGNHSYTVYPKGSFGNAMPSATIIGTHTGLVSPWAIAEDVAGNSYVSEIGSNQITVFASGANGNATPIRTIAGVSTMLNGPSGVAVSITGKVYVVNRVGGTITVYGKNANGNAAPVATIGGASTKTGGTAISLREPVQTVGIHLTGEMSITDPHYGFILGYFNGTTSTTSQVVHLTAGDPVQFKNVDIVMHTAAFLGNATATSAPWPASFNGATTTSPAGTAIGPTFTTGNLNPGQTSLLYNAGGPGFRMIGCFYHYNSSEMRTVVVVM